MSSLLSVNSPAKVGLLDRQLEKFQPLILQHKAVIIELVSEIKNSTNPNSSFNSDKSQSEYKPVTKIVRSKLPRRDRTLEYDWDIQ